MKKIYTMIFTKYITNELNKKNKMGYFDRIKEITNLRYSQKTLPKNNDKNCNINLKKEYICTPENLRFKDGRFKVSFVDPLVLDKFNYDLYKSKINSK